MIIGFVQGLSLSSIFIAFMLKPKNISNMQPGSTCIVDLIKCLFIVTGRELDADTMCVLKSMRTLKRKGVTYVISLEVSAHGLYLKKIIYLA